MSDLKLTLTERLALMCVRFLSWQRGLEGFMCLIGIMWSLGILASGNYFATGCGIPQVSFMSPDILAMIVMVSCGIGFIGMQFRSSYLRMQTSIITSIAWGLRAVMAAEAPNTPWQGVSLYGCFALAELCIYIRIYTGLDKRENQISKVQRGTGNVGRD